jgi:hypothetical protein
MRAQDAGLGDLREAVLKAEDIEIRIWLEPAMFLDVAEGYVLQRLASTWSGRHNRLKKKDRVIVIGDEKEVSIFPPPKDEWEVGEIAPRNGWDSLWTTLERTGLLSLPDESRLDLRATRGMKEGFIYVVEIKTTDAYRTYRYTNPENYDTPETKGMVRIVQIIHEEFLKDQQE